MSSPPSEDERAEDLRAAFRMMDRDGDGRITFTDLRYLLDLMDYTTTDTEAIAMLRQATSGSTRELTLEDFERMMRPLTGREGEEELESAFRFFDLDGNGFISVDEMRVVIESFGEKIDNTEIRAILQDADADSDGRIDFQEFKRLMCSHLM